MPDARTAQSVIDAAEQAAARGDSTSAERLLREAIALQEAELGPFHPDLAHTLNNLGVVCEFMDKPADAEQCYRRAFAIATAALDPDHPIVATSGKNLRDFCNARGIAVEPPSSPPVVNAPPPQAPSGERQSQEEPSSDEPRSTGSARSPRSVVIGILGTVALLLVVVLVPRSWFSSDAPPESSAVDTTSRPAEPSTPAPNPQPPAPKDAPPTATDASPVPKEALPAPKQAPAAAASPVRESRPTPTAAPTSLTVVEARLCRRLSTESWRCEEITSPVDAGPMVFYTRVKSPTDTTVLHRWYQGDRVHQVVELPIRANPGDGYRTFSRNTINSGRAGDWRVELRTKDGILLHEERFVVR